MFADKFQHSIRYAQWVAAKTFAGLEWPMKHYAKAELRPIEDFEILAERINDKNKEVCLIELDEDTAKWVPKSKGMLRVPVKVPSRWKPFRSHGLRKRREITNKHFYKMEFFQRAAFGGWTETSRVDTVSGAMEHYDYLDLSEFAESTSILPLSSKVPRTRAPSPVVDTKLSPASGSVCERPEGPPIDADQVQRVADSR